MSIEDIIKNHIKEHEKNLREIKKQSTKKFRNNFRKLDV